MKMKKLSTIALAAVMAIGTFGFSVPAKAAELPGTTDYVLTIPATLGVASAGWNATDGITAQVKSGDTFDSSKKLTVTAASANEWNLKSGENAIAYKMASATEQEKSYADATATTSLEISAEDLNTGNYKAPFGIVVEDYTDKPAGEYKDTVTFTAKVQNASTPVTAITLNKTTATLYYLSNTVKVPETLNVTSVTPADATDKSVTWSSDNTKVATVDASTGKVTAVAAGTANITATANGGTNITAKCAVTVTDISGDYSNMVECGCDNLTGTCVASNGLFTAKSLDGNVAIALAKGKATETGNNCAVFYYQSGRGREVYFAKNDGTTGQARYRDDASDKGLSGYEGYYVNN